MSRKWKVAVGVLTATVVVVAIVIGVGSVVTLQRSSGGYTLPWAPRGHYGEPEVVSELEVRLLDDDGDGVPDRGVIDLPAAWAHARPLGLDGDWRFHHRGLEPGHDLLFRPIFGPFVALGGVMGALVLLGLVPFVATCVAWRLCSTRRPWGPPPWWGPSQGPAGDEGEPQKPVTAEQ